MWKIAMGILLIVGCLWGVVSYQMMIWGDTSQLKAEELWLAKFWTVIGAAGALFGAGLVTHHFWGDR